MKIYLIRHGKTEANVKRLYCGQTDVPLCQIGREELEQLKKEIDYPEASHFFYTGMKRTKETLKLLYDREGIIVEDLKEIDFGIFEMKHYDELKETKEFQSWIQNFETMAPKNGESKIDFEERVMKGYQGVKEYLQTRECKEVVIVTHGGVIATIMEKEFPNQKNFYEWQPSHGRGYEIIDAVIEKTTDKIIYEGKESYEGNTSHKFWNVL